MSMKENLETDKLIETLSIRIKEDSEKLDSIANLISLNGIYDDATSVLESIADILESTGRPVELDGGDETYLRDE